MDDEAQAAAYARADFADVNAGFVREALRRHPDLATAQIVDLGCGPGDIPLRLARAAPAARIVGIDASLPMLRLARRALARARCGSVWVVHARVQALPFRAGQPGGVVSNSLVHHLPEPARFWEVVRDIVPRDGAIHVMDLARPASPERARAIVDAAAAEAEPLLRRDFYNSLLAALTPAEVEADLAAAGLAHLTCEVVGDRHWLVSGRR